MGIPRREGKGADASVILNTHHLLTAQRTGVTDQQQFDEKVVMRRNHVESGVKVHCRMARAVADLLKV
jgi:hypothetical protein